MDGTAMDPSQLRVGDAERQAMAERLATAHAVGQLDVEEFDERVSKAHAARTRGELDALAVDLPGAESPGREAAAVGAGTADRLRAAGAMVGAVPRNAWIAIAGLLAILGISGLAFGDGGEGYERAPHGGMGTGYAEHVGEQTHDYSGWAFFGGAASMLGLLILIAAVVFVIHRLRRR